MLQRIRTIWMWLGALAVAGFAAANAVWPMQLALLAAGVLLALLACYHVEWIRFDRSKLHPEVSFAGLLCISLAMWLIWLLGIWNQDARGFIAFVRAVGLIWPITALWLSGLAALDGVDSWMNARRKDEEHAL